MCQVPLFYMVGFSSFPHLKQILKLIFILCCTCGNNSIRSGIMSVLKSDADWHMFSGQNWGIV